ncbi:MAG: metal-dependent transcriptional regulator [Oscillospiraceae bacterium]|nr:metal-dependent transcriptional regulator [Oscillospiraceae bacterium]
MALKESGEMYLESIYVLLNEKGIVRSIDVAEKMGFSKPSVSRAIGILKNNELISVSREGYITLTEVGLVKAKQIFERHTVVSNVLIALGVPKEIADDDACRIEHIISEETFLAIKKYLNGQK